MTEPRAGARILVIGGVDPSGGAGLIRDAWALRSFGASAASASFVVSAFTEQAPGRPARAWALSPERFARQLDAALAAPGAVVAKLGLLPATLLPPLLAALVRARGRVRLVVDPVLEASAGGSMGVEPAALTAVFEHAELITPNPRERAILAEPLRAAGVAVLAKSATLGPDRVEDQLLRGDELLRAFSRPRVRGPDPRGSGCALASRIAGELAAGAELARACARAIDWLDGARAQLRRGRDGRWHFVEDPGPRPARPPSQRVARVSRRSTARS